MNTVKITFEANGQELKVTSNPALFASNTVDYIEAEFTLGDNWSFQSVRAIWVTDFECIATVLDQNGKCIVPQEVLTKALPVKVNLVGSDVDNNELVDRLTTYPIVALVVNENAKICGTETAPITPSQFEQFIAIVNEKVDTVRDITSCVLNPDYTLTINYSDGTSDTVGPIRGAQGETGNGISKIEKTNTSGLVDTYRITYTDGTHTDYTVTNGAKGDTGNGVQSIEKISTVGLVDTYRITYTNGQTKDYIVTNGEKGDTGNGIDRIELTSTNGSVKTYTIYFTDGNTFEYTVTDGQVTFADLEPLLIKDTVSGDIASFPDGQNVFPLRKCEVTLSPIQDLHGYDKPWVGGSGANKWDEQWEVGGIVNATGQPYNATDRIRSKNFCACLPNTAYFGMVDYAIYFYDENQAFISYTGTLPTGSVITTPNTAHYFKIVKTGVTTYSNNICFNYPSTVTTYSPYSNICPITGWTGCNLVVSPTQDAQDGTTYPVSWQTEAGTVYGGTVDLVTGVLTVTNRTRIVTDSDSFTVGSSGNNRFYLSDTFDPAKKAKNPSNGICSHYGTFVPYANSTSALTADYSVGVFNASSNFIEYYVRDSRFSTAQEITTYYAQQYTGGTPLQFTFDLATPQTYQLDPVQVACLLGQNNVWSDGEIEVTYVADTGLYILKKLSE